MGSAKGSGSWLVSVSYTHLDVYKRQVYIVLLQAGIIPEARRLTKEVKAQRELADTAEASRFTELRTLLEGELRRIEAQTAASNREFVARMEQSERGMQPVSYTHLDVYKRQELPGTDPDRVPRKEPEPDFGEPERSVYQLT